MNLRKNPKKKEVFTVDKQNRGSTYVNQEIKKTYGKISLKDRKYDNKDNYYYQVKKNQEMHNSMTEEEKKLLMETIPQTEKHHTLNFLLKKKAREEEKQKQKEEQKKLRQSQQMQFQQQLQQQNQLQKDQLQKAQLLNKDLHSCFQKEKYGHNQDQNQNQHQNCYFSKNLPLCNLCLRSFSTEYQEEKHFQNYHKETGHILCVNCEEEFYKRKHFQKHLQQNKECQKKHEKLLKFQLQAREYFGEEEEQAQPAYVFEKDHSITKMFCQNIKHHYKQLSSFDYQYIARNRENSSENEGENKQIELNRIGNDELKWADSFDENDLQVEYNPDSDSDSDSISKSTQITPNQNQQKEQNNTNNNKNNNDNSNNNNQEEEETTAQKTQFNNIDILNMIYENEEKQNKNINTTRKKEKKIQETIQIVENENDTEKEKSYWINNFFKTTD